MASSDYRLLPTVKNTIFRLIERFHLDPAEFQWEDVQANDHYTGRSTTSKLVHTPSQFYYTFGGYRDDYSPGASRQRLGSKDISNLSWGNPYANRLTVVENWLESLQTEIQAPDLWAQLLQEKRLSRFATTSLIQNPTFSADEKHYVARQLEDIKQRLIEQHQLQSDQVAAITEGFESVVEAMNRLGKKDWFNYAVGLLLNIAVATAFSPSAAKDLLHRFSDAVQPLFDAFLKLIGQ